jgi:hypothetical protein
MRNLILVGLAAATLASCAAAPPPMRWVRTDGQRASKNPVLASQAEIDRTVCLGERQKATLSGITFANGGFAAAVAAQERGNSADAVARGCMAEKGYLLVPEDQAEAKAAELAAIAEQKRKQEATAAAAAPKPRKPMMIAKPATPAT